MLLFNKQVFGLPSFFVDFFWAISSSMTAKKSSSRGLADLYIPVCENTLHVNWNLEYNVFGVVMHIAWWPWPGSVNSVNMCRVSILQPNYMHAPLICFIYWHEDNVSPPPPRSKLKTIICGFFAQYIMHTAEVGGTQISSANRKSAYLRTYKIFIIAGLLHVWQLADLRLSDPIFLGFEDLRYEDPIFCGLKTSANSLFFSEQINTLNVLIRIFIK